MDNIVDKLIIHNIIHILWIVLCKVNYPHMKQYYFVYIYI